MLNKKQIIYALEEIADETIEGIKLSEVKLEDGKTSLSIDLIIKAPKNEIKAPKVGWNTTATTTTQANDIESVRKQFEEQKLIESIKEQTTKG